MSVSREQVESIIANGSRDLNEVVDAIMKLIYPPEREITSEIVAAYKQEIDEILGESAALSHLEERE